MATLCGALSRPHHAYLFCGPGHVGKQTAALWFAQGLNCVQRDTGGGCGVCSDCEAIARGQHPDVRIFGSVSDEQRIKVEQVRELNQAVQAKPFSGAYQVFVLTDVDAMTVGACNALLKTLEEPPGETVLVLIARDPEAVLPTLVSRCVLVHFSLVDAASVADALRVRHPDLSADTRQAVVLRAQGRIGEAFRLASEGVEERLALAWPTVEDCWVWAENLAQMPTAKQEQALDEWLSGLHQQVRTLAPTQGSQAAIKAALMLAEGIESARRGLLQHGSAKLVFDQLARRFLQVQGLVTEGGD